MDIPQNLLKGSIEVGYIYYFVDNRLKDTKKPHYFVVVGIDDGSVVLFMVGTSQFAKASKRIELRKQDFATLVKLKPVNGINELKTETYIDCNSVFKYSIEDFHSKFLNKDIKAKGKISNAELSQIHIGVSKSKQLTGQEKEVINNSIPEDLKS